MTDAPTPSSLDAESPAIDRLSVARGAAQTDAEWDAAVIAGGIAIEANDIEALRELLATHGPGLANWPARYDRSLIWVAARVGSFESFEMLFQRANDETRVWRTVGSDNLHGWLGDAVIGQNEKAARMVIEAGADIRRAAWRDKTDAFHELRSLFMPQRSERGVPEPEALFGLLLDACAKLPEEDARPFFESAFRVMLEGLHTADAQGHSKKNAASRCVALFAEKIPTALGGEFLARRTVHPCIDEFFARIFARIEGNLIRGVLQEANSPKLGEEGFTASETPKKPVARL